MYLINRSIYFLDLPGYGFARVSGAGRERLTKLIRWYLLDSEYVQKRVVLVLDAEVGPTQADREALHMLREAGKSIVIVANKVDKIKSSERQQHLRSIQEFAGDLPVVPYSSKERTGVEELTEELVG